jgi:Rhodopirellula transposase DDE domain
MGVFWGHGRAMSSVDGVAVLAGKFAEVRPHLDERAWRLYLGSEARALAVGGSGLGAAVAVVAAAAGVSRATVLAGAGELAAGAGPLAGRVRRPGAGRRKAEDAQPGLARALETVLEATVRGDPVSAVTWTTLSLRDLEREMAALGFACRKDALARMLHEAGYSLQGMSRVLEGRRHPDRDAQFRHVNAMVAEFAAAGEPAVSADGKKKEQLGPYGRAGRSWRPAGDPVRVRSHDFPDLAAGRAVPYGVYGIAANRGFAVVGTSHETAAFAVGALRRWWLAEGSLRYPGARRLLVTCDAGGSNACVSRGWKDGLACLAAETGLEVTVCHFPPGTQCRCLSAANYGALAAAGG